MRYARGPGKTKPIRQGPLYLPLDSGETAGHAGVVGAGPGPGGDEGVGAGLDAGRGGQGWKRAGHMLPGLGRTSAPGCSWGPAGGAEGVAAPVATGIAAGAIDGRDKPAWGPARDTTTSPGRIAAIRGFRRPVRRSANCATQASIRAVPRTGCPVRLVFLSLAQNFLKNRYLAQLLGVSLIRYSKRFSGRDWRRAAPGRTMAGMVAVLHRAGSGVGLGSVPHCLLTLLNPYSPRGVGPHAQTVSGSRPVWPM